MSNICVAVASGDQVEVIHPVQISVDDIIAMLPEGANYRTVGDDLLPLRVFRAAWQLIGPFLDINMTIAREIQKDRWREVRQPLLEALDIEYLRALENNDTSALAMIAAQKQALRDVTLIDLSSVETPEALDAYWPEILT